MFKSPEFWKWFFSILGPSTFIGAILFFFLSAWRDHWRWAADNKKSEWRQLIDCLRDGISGMALGFESVVRPIDEHEPMNNPETAYGEGIHLLRDRIFIAGAIRKYKIESKWTELAQYIEMAHAPRDPHQRGALTRTGYFIKANAFQEELVNIARRDLGLDSRIKLLWSRLVKKYRGG